MESIMSTSVDNAQACDTPRQCTHDFRVNCSNCRLNSLCLPLALESEDTHSQQMLAMRDSLAKLDDRSRDIIQQRWLSEDKSTLHELASKYDVSAERIRQLEANALKKMRTSFAF